MATLDTTPIAYDLALTCDAATAFGTYVDEIAVWRHADYTASPSTLESITIEPQVGGRVYATHSDIGEHDWAR